MKLIGCIVLKIIALTSPFLLMSAPTLPQREITPSAVPGGAKMFLGWDFIYWDIRQDGLSYACSGNGLNTSRGSVYRPDFTYKPGLKAEIGGYLPHDGWDLTSQYTWLKSDVSSSKGGNAQTGLRPKWNVGGNLDLSSSNVDLLHARSKWDIHFHTLNLELGRNFFISQRLTLRPYLGAKGAYISQDYIAKYIPLDPIALDASLLKMQMDQNYWGAGVRGGMQSKWILSDHWNITAGLALSGIWSWFDTDRVDQRENSSGITTTLINIRNQLDTINPVLELSAGLGWETRFHKDQCRFELSAGWELQQWWSQNQYILLSSPGSGGDLSIQGLTIKARFDF